MRRSCTAVGSLLLVVCGCSSARDESQPQLRIAVASSLSSAYDEIAGAFERETGVRVILSPGSSGKLAAQIEQGAPFDLYAAADQSFVDRVIDAGACQAASKTVYAIGRLAVWSDAGTVAPESIAALAEPRFARISLANPEHAPYGRAAREALQQAGLWTRLRADRRLVFGANVRQALQFAETGNTDLALIPLALAAEKGGDYFLVDEAAHGPLNQAAVVCRSDAEQIAKRFLGFLSSSAGRETLARYGFLQPGTDATQLPPSPREQSINWAPLWLSLRVASLATLLALLLGVGIATLLASCRFPGREIVDSLLTAPMVLPPTVMGYYLLVTLGRRSSIGEWYEGMTGSPIAFTVTGAVVAATVGALPLVIKSARAALEAVDPTLPQAARTLGAGPIRSFFTIRLQLAMPGVVAGAMLGFAKALGDFGATLMIAGDIPGETQTAALYIYDAIQANRGNQAAGMVAVLSAVAVVVLYGVNKLTRRESGER